MAQRGPFVRGARGHSARWLRVGLVTAIVAVATALLGVVWASHLNVRATTRTVVRGEAATLYGAIRDRLAAAPDQPVATRLANALDALAKDDLHYVALVNPGGIEAEAGMSSLAPGALLAFAKLAQPGVPVVDGDRARVFYRRPRTLGGSPGEPVAGDGLVIELYPSIARDLSRSGARTLAIGILAALTLIGLSVVLVRWSLNREATVRSMEQARHLANLGQMSAVLAHEIRNPLASLKGNAQLLAASLPEGDKPRGKADRIVDEASRLETLTNDLLEFARDGQLHVADVDPGALARDAAAAVSSDRIKIETDAAPRSWPMDPARMRQVVINLVENAVELSDEPVELTVTRADKNVILTVADRGPGIAEADLARVFDPFFTKRTRGTGLGLAVARRLVELHGGTITARTRDGGGTVFEVVVPR